MIEVQPRFNMKKVWLPTDHRKDVVAELRTELKSVTMKGIKSKRDDMLDTVSMMANMPIIAPSTEGEARYNTMLERWELTHGTQEDTNSYLID